jgi:hypothetical protein
MARGLFRIWLVLTIIWTTFIFLVSGHDSRPEALVIALEASLVPSGVVFVIGLMVWWAIKVFSRHN